VGGREGLTADIDASIGTVGDAYDNALAESTIGLYKTELIRDRYHCLGGVVQQSTSS
jgi:transposase InsO family protein